MGLLKRWDLIESLAMVSASYRLDISEIVAEGQSDSVMGVHAPTTSLPLWLFCSWVHWASSAGGGGVGGRKGRTEAA